MILLDTDHISVLQRQPEARNRLVEKLDQSRESPVTSIITFEEQMRSWISAIARRRDVAEQVVPYLRLLQMLEFFEEWEIIPFNIDTADRFRELRSQRIRVATTDLKIAAIALANDLTLLTANTRDFEKVPGLRFENWLS